MTFNPLFLYGGVGFKTQLHAIACDIRPASPRSGAVLSGTVHAAFAGCANARSWISEPFRTVEVLMVDDVQFIAGDPTQEEFFHRSIRLSIRASRSSFPPTAPRRDQGLEERIKSRL